MWNYRKTPYTIKLTLMLIEQFNIENNSLMKQTYQKFLVKIQLPMVDESGMPLCYHLKGTTSLLLHVTSLSFIPHSRRKVRSRYLFFDLKICLIDLFSVSLSVLSPTYLSQAYVSISHVFVPSVFFKS
jgi:hypothetical protein